MTVLERTRLKLQQELQDLVEKVENLGFVATVERKPLTPLAMGNARTVVVVRPSHFYYRQKL